MPTQTFYNLDKAKKDKVINAIKKEFSSKKVLDMSVKNIVEEANIARGSFYQYFNSKEDLINYMLREEYRNEIENIKKLLEKNNGDLFDSAYEYLILSLTLTEEEKRYAINITEYLKDYAIQEIKKIDISILKEHINLEKLNINNGEEFCAALTIIIALICVAKISILAKLTTYEEGINNYNTQISIIKKGLIK